MADVSIQIAGRSYTLACKEGGEAHLEGLAGLLDSKAAQLLDQLGPMNESRTLLLSALLLADELHELRTNGASPSRPPAALEQQFAQLAERAEALVRRMDGTAP